jgi:hypothetical protein
MGGRSTVIKLSNGGIWVIASTPLSKETKEAVDRLGSVRYMFNPHYILHLILTTQLYLAIY